MLAREITHLKVGAQKKIVKGPAGCAMKAFKVCGKNVIFKTLACIFGTIPHIFIDYVF